MPGSFNDEKRNALMGLLGVTTGSLNELEYAFWKGINDGSIDLGGGGVVTPPVDPPVDPPVGPPVIPPVTPTFATKTFSEATQQFANPERGWFQYTETHWRDAAGAGFTPLVKADIINSRLNTNVINEANIGYRSTLFRYYIMDHMRTVDAIPAAFLAAVAADIVIAREAGVKLIIRFTYSSDGTNTTPVGPYNTDTTPTRTFGHISQLTATVNAGADVILAVQAGFIGTWGEWYYTDNWGNVGTLSAQNWTDRANLITNLLNWDSRIFILLRYPGLKHRYMQGTGIPAANLNRIGFHNDAFLADAEGEDWGTYNTFTNGMTVAQTKTYLIAETARPVFMSGETAGVSPRATNYANAASEMDTYNWSTLNPEYHPDVLKAWTQAQRDEVSRRLGYRLRLISAALPTLNSINADVSVTLTIANDGWALPIINRPIQIVFVQGTTKIVRTLAKSIRTLASGQNVITETVKLPSTTGDWNIHLSMPDPNPSIANRSEYAIRLANTTVYSGVLNDLGASVTLV